MTTSAFLCGSKNQVMRLLRVPYGHLYVEDISIPMPFFTVEEAVGHVEVLLRAEKLTADEATHLQNEVRDSGLLPDWRTVAELVKGYHPPDDDYLPAYEFELNDEEDRELDTASGWIVLTQPQTSETLRKIQYIKSLSDAFGWFMKHGKNMRHREAADLLAKIARSAVPATYQTE